jgi:hypothetical protein
MNIKQHHQPYIIVIKLATSKLRPSNNNHARNNTHITLLHYSIPFSRSNSRGRSSISRAGAAAIAGGPEAVATARTGGATAGVGAASAGQEQQQLQEGQQEGQKQ